MQYKIFTFSIFDDSHTDDMNRFLRGNRVVQVEKQFVVMNGNAYWTFCVYYIGVENKEPEVKGKTDYKNVLDEPTFAIFSKLRTYRKKIAEEDAVPAYAVFTDAELSEIAKLDEITEKKLLSIQGIGEKRVDKYGKTMCSMVAEEKEKEEKR
jgi:superfamily II DNA helicase RecQ